MNPYYDTKELGFEMISFNEPLDYAFNTLIFLATPEGQIYTAKDKGCSCPTPFEEYVGASQKEILPLLERVGSIEQAKTIFDSWNKNFDDRPILSRIESEKEIEEFFDKYFK